MEQQVELIEEHAIWIGTAYAPWYIAHPTPCLAQYADKNTICRQEPHSHNLTLTPHPYWNKAKTLFFFDSMAASQCPRKFTKYPPLC